MDRQLSSHEIFDEAPSIQNEPRKKIEVEKQESNQEKAKSASLLSSRIKCKIFETFQFPGIALLSRCGSDFTFDPPSSSSSSSSSLSSSFPALKTVFNHTQHDREEEAEKINVLIHFLDRFYPYNNHVKLSAWMKKKTQKNITSASASSCSSFFSPFSSVSDLKDFLHSNENSVAEWDPSLEFDATVNFVEAAAKPVISTMLREIFNSEVVVVETDAEEEKGDDEGEKKKKKKKVLRIRSLLASGEKEQEKAKQDLFWSWKRLTENRSELIKKINHKGKTAMKFNAVCQLMSLLCVSFVRELSIVPDSSEKTKKSFLPNQGIELEKIKIDPRGKRFKNLFIEQSDSDADETLLDFDCTFHTSSSEFHILFPDITDLTSSHIKRLLKRSKQLEQTQEKNKASFASSSSSVTSTTAAASSSQNSSSSSSSSSSSPQSPSFDPEFEVMPIPLLERVPFMTFFPRTKITMSHEVQHVVQGIVNHADPSRFKMLSESDPSKLEEPIAFLIAKEFENHNLLRHIFAPGTAELHPMIRFERCATQIGKLSPGLRREYETFLTDFGSKTVEVLEKSKAQSDFQQEDSAWAIANLMAYNMMPFFTTEKVRVQKILQLIFAEPRQNCNLTEEKFCRRKELAEAVEKNELEDPVIKFRTMLDPAKDASEKICSHFTSS